MDYIKPVELVKNMIAAGDTKAGLSVKDLLIRGFLSGALLGFATSLALTATAQTNTPLVGALVFPVGFVMIVLLGLELVTGSFAVTTLAAVDGRRSWGQVGANLTWVFLANLAGSIAYGLLLYVALTGMGSEAPSGIALRIVSIAEAKTVGYAAHGTAGFVTVVVKAILCNWMVCLGVVMAFTSHSTLGKIAAMWLPILTFFAQGFEHSVVNMFLIPTGMLLGAKVSFSDWWLWNQLPVTLGNFVGGFLFTGLFLYWTYRPAPAAPAAGAAAPESARGELVESARAWSAMAAPAPTTGFTPEQKQYLEGFLRALAGQAPFAGHTAAGQLTATPGEAAANLAAEDTVFGTPLADLSKPERWKYDENPLDIWEKLVAHADADKFPDEADTFRFKFHGLFYVAPAQDSFMLRLRLPAGEISAAQLDGLAEIADWGGGCTHITTRANLQVRELKPRDIIKVLVRLQELGLTSRGAGADNIRNITASPNSGFDPDELIDVRPFARGLHHYILNHRDLYGLPRKFNIAFDNGGSLSTAADTNDIGFTAVSVTAASLSTLNSQPSTVPPGIYFRVELGGISGHGDFAKDTGLLLKPSECVAVAAAMVRVFSEHGDRTNRKKARLKYLLEKWGVEKFAAETAKKLAFPLVRLPLAACEPRKPHFKHGWLGVHRQAQRGFNSVGAGTPVGRLTSRQMRRVAELATSYGKGELRLTVWQSFLIPHVPDAFAETTRRGLQRAGFYTEASLATGGIVACTGNKGCKYSAADTKAHALALMKHLGDRVPLDSPVNIHFTGCPHSCAQHYCGDIGLVGAKLSDGSEGYHLVLGGGMGHEQGIAREIFRGVNATEVPKLAEQILRTYQAGKHSGESFVAWSRRHSVKELQELLSS